MKPRQRHRMGRLGKLGGLLALLLVSTGGCGGGSEPVITVLEGTWLGHELGSQNEWSFLIRSQGFYLSGPDTWMRGSFVVAPDLGELDLVIEECDCPYVGEQASARFRLEGDTLHIAGLEPGSAGRPVTATGGGGARAFRFLRFVEDPGEGGEP